MIFEISGNHIDTKEIAIIGKIQCIQSGYEHYEVRLKSGVELTFFENSNAESNRNLDMKFYTPREKLLAAWKLDY